MEELLTHVIVESFAHGETFGSLRTSSERTPKKLTQKTDDWRIGTYHAFVGLNLIHQTSH